MSIPKILHYCWFGGNPLPKETLKYMESWKRYCPDFEIKVWDESNFDIHCCPYVEEAYKAKKWAFVADYARFYAMYLDGGVYVETDTEIIRPINDLLSHNAFFGFGIETMTLPLCGTTKNNPVAKAMLDYYSHTSFLKKGKYDMTTVNQILFNTLKSYFGLSDNRDYQVLDGDIAIYPKEYFFSTNWKTGVVEKNSNLYVIHHADASWMPANEREILRLKRQCISLFGEKLGNVIGIGLSKYKIEGIKGLYVHGNNFMKRSLTPLIMKVVSSIYCNRKKVVFKNFAGRGYGDNPKYIAKELLDRNQGYDLVWVVNKGCNYSFPTGIRTVRNGSYRELIELSSAKFWVDNNRKEECVYKSQKQIYIQTWHGFYPLKKMEKDAIDTLSKSHVLKAIHDGQITDLMVSGCKARTKIYQTSFWYEGEIKECGTPRNDVFFKDVDYRKHVGDFFGISREKKLLLYAPTFRDDHSIDAYDIDFERTLEHLTHRLGGDWCVLVRLHPAVRERSSEFVTYNETIIDASSYDDIQELFAACDFLISDYSDCMFEFSLTYKPVILYASDLDAFTHGRSFYYDIHELPYQIAENNDELSSLIDNFNEEDYKNRLKKFFDKIGVFEKGTASKAVVDYIIENS